MHSNHSITTDRYFSIAVTDGERQWYYSGRLTPDKLWEDKKFTVIEFRPSINDPWLEYTWKEAVKNLPLKVKNIMNTEFKKMMAETNPKKRPESFVSKLANAF